MARPGTILGILRDPKGVALVFITLAMTAIIGFAALGIDVGYLCMVKGQLQNSADACALAGAGALYPVTSATPLATLPPPDWDRARAVAGRLVRQTVAAGETLSDVQVQYGYWNLAARQWKPGSPVTAGLPPGPPAGACSVSGNPCSAAASCPKYPSEGCNLSEVPAVMATVGREAGVNGGPVPLFFAGVVGVPFGTPSANSLAARGAPKSLSRLFPFAISECAANDYFSQNPLPNPPTTITDVSVYHTQDGKDIVPGQWTDLLPEKYPSSRLVVDYIENLIDPSRGTSPPPVAVDGSTYVDIDPGTKASVYHATRKLIEAGKGLVYLPVIQTPSDCSITPGTTLPIVGFAAFEITSTTNGSMTGHFVGPLQSSPSSITGGNSGMNVVAPPVLVR